MEYNFYSVANFSLTTHKTPTSIIALNRAQHNCPLFLRRKTELGCDITEKATEDMGSRPASVLILWLVTWDKHFHFNKYQNFARSPKWADWTRWLLRCHQSSNSAMWLSLRLYKTLPEKTPLHTVLNEQKAAYSVMRACLPPCAAAAQLQQKC